MISMQPVFGRFHVSDPRLRFAASSTSGASIPKVFINPSKASGFKGTSGGFGWRFSACLSFLAVRKSRYQVISRRANAAKAEAVVQAYGEWESPITASFITAGAIKLGAVSCGPDGTLHWMEGRPQEGGRQVVCCFGEDGKVDLIPEDVNARTRVHEYGGVSYWISPEGGLFYINFTDQRLYVVKSAGEEPVCLTPSSAYEEDRRYRFADCVFDLARNRLICIREDHTNPKPSEVKNTICSVSLDGSGKMEVLVEGFDFYAAPKLSPNGEELAYICWNHPSMPWESTQLRLAKLDEQGFVASEETISGGDDETSVLQPSWSPSGTLHFIADTSGWWNLYCFDEETAPWQNPNGVLFLIEEDPTYGSL